MSHRINFLTMISFTRTSSIIFIFLLAMACKNSSSRKKEIDSDSTLFPSELVNFIPYKGNPVFSGADSAVWDEEIRERGYILKENDGYHMWYTGYKKDKPDTLFPGYATSPDGINWTRYIHNPIFHNSWTEDMMIVKSDSLYYMFAEGRGDTAHMLTSTDKIHWKDHGPLLILYTNGQPITPGPYGTPTVWIEDNTWYLFYERNDSAVCWLHRKTSKCGRMCRMNRYSTKVRSPTTNMVWH